MKACSASTYNAMVTRTLLLFAVMVMVACTKDEATVHLNASPGQTDIATPVKAPVWQPAPKRGAVAPGYSAQSPVAGIPGTVKPSTNGTASLAAGSYMNATGNDRAPDGGAYGEYVWPSAVQAQSNPKYSPWRREQAPRPATGKPAKQAARRPWGSDAGTYTQQQGAQNVWQFQSGQAGQDPLTIKHQSGVAPPTGVVFYPVWSRYPGHVW